VSAEIPDGHGAAGGMLGLADGDGVVSAHVLSDGHGLVTHFEQRRW
jgi:hypothetical protein